MARTPTIAAEVADTLRALLPHAGERSLDGLVRAAAVGSVKRRDRILTEEIPPRLVLMLDGYAGTWRTDAEGRIRLVGVSGPGELAGLRALSPTRAPIELVAFTNGRAATFDPETVMRLARADANLSADLLELALVAADGLLARVDNASGAAAGERIVSILWHRRELAFDPGRPILTRAQLSGLASSTRDQTDRVIRELEEDGVIERVGRTGLVLHDEAALQRLAERADEAV